jgi:two-component system chemotaxis sensor kinase CheA
LVVLFSAKAMVRPLGGYQLAGRRQSQTYQQGSLETFCRMCRYCEGTHDATSVLAIVAGKMRCQGNWAKSMSGMCQEDLETIREFLVESHENLSQLDQNLVELERRPKDAALLGSIFRTFHTIKGACGFLAFSTLEKITHQAESLLCQLRDGQRELEPVLVSLILETVDASRKILESIEATGEEGGLHFDDLTERLRAAAETKTVPEIQPASSPKIQPIVPQPVVEPTASKAAPEPPDLQLVEAEDRRKEERRKDERRKTSQGEDEESSRSSAAADANIRVGVLLLDKLMDLVGELVLTRNQILQFNAEREDAALNATSQRLNLITSELQEGVMKTRMQPIGVVWNNLPRVVRDMAVSLGKQIQIKMDGADTELDRTIIEAIKDPLIHLVRNSCDHGIESPETRMAAGKPGQGTMTLRAYHEGGQVTIEVGDDGAGIDISRVKQKAVEKGLLRAEHLDKLSERESMGLIFLPGFSTAQTVTNISGRGVGMDVVKSHIEKIGGSVDLFSRPGEGTTVKIRIPLTLAIIPGLIITSGGERFVIPQVSLIELIHLDEESSKKHIEYVHGTPVYRRRGTLLPIIYLNQVLGLEPPNPTCDAGLVVLQANDRQFGLVVDNINDTQEIVVKPLGKLLKGITLYAGATIMGDGRVALILDVLGIGQRSGVLGEVREQARAAETRSTGMQSGKQSLLLFQAGSFQRVAVSLSLVARIEEFPQSSIEHAASGQVVQYRNRILPLVSLQSILEPEAPERATADLIQVVVFNDGDRSVGMVVDELLDIAEEVIKVRQQSSRQGLLGSAVVDTLVTDILDVNAVLDASRAKQHRTAEACAGEKSILIADSTIFARGMIRSGLDMAGYIVAEAANLDEAILRLEQHPVDLVVAARDLPPDGCSALLSLMRRRSGWERIPVLATASSVEELRAFDSGAAGFQGCQLKSDRIGILQSVVQLVSSAAGVERASVGAGEKR